jgi:hypothetical protein
MCQGRATSSWGNRTFFVVCCLPWFARPLRGRRSIVKRERIQQQHQNLFSSFLHFAAPPWASIMESLSSSVLEDMPCSSPSTSSTDFPGTAPTAPTAQHQVAHTALQPSTGPCTRGRRYSASSSRVCPRASSLQLAFWEKCIEPDGIDCEHDLYSHSLRRLRVKALECPNAQFITGTGMHSILLATGLWKCFIQKKKILTRIWLISSVVQNLFLALEGRSVVVLVVVLVVGATFIAILFIVIIIIIFLILICAFASSVQFVTSR